MLEDHNLKIIKIDETYEEFENKGKEVLKNNSGKDLLFLTAFFKNDWFAKLCDIFPNRRIVYMIIDSGLGSYEQMIDKDIRKRCLSGDTIDARKYIREDQKLILNTRLSGVYLESLLTAKIDNKEYLDSILKDSVLICTQPLIEDEIIKDVRDVELYKDIIKAAKSEGLKVCLKMHPREVKDKYDNLDVNIIKSDNTVEEILANCNKPRCIISPFSTVGIDAKLLYGIPAYNVYKILGVEGYEYLEEMYGGLFGFPKTIDEISELKNKKRRNDYTRHFLSTSSSYADLLASFNIL